MKIILIEDVQNLGYKDDVVEVKNGYGRNFLIPTKKAILATPSALKQLAEKQKQQAQKMAKIKADAEAVAEQIKGLTLTISAKASEEGKLYGAVTNIQLAEAFEAAGAKIERKTIVAETVKELGSYTCTVKLHREVSVEVPFNVVAANAE
jgi:large subunit ribosomal protein L9